MAEPTVVLDRPPLSPVARARMTLAARTTLVMTAVTALTVLLVGLAMLGLVRGAAEKQARAALAGQADVLASQVDTRGGVRALQAARVLHALGIDAAVVGSDRADQVLGSVEQQRVRNGESVSAARDGKYIEARPTDSGGIVLWQEARIAQQPQREDRRRYLAVLALGAGGGALAGYLLTRRLTRSLRAAARAARRMSSGARNVRLEDGGPAEVVELSDAINQLSTALAVSEGRQRDFLVSVSHELRTPLTSVRGYAEALADGVVAPDEAAATGRLMLAEAQRLDRLVNDLLDLARLRAQDFRLDLADVDVTEVVREATRIWQDRCEREDVRFIGEIPAGPIHARSDAARIRQIIDNLAENALRVTPAGAPIVLGLRPEGPYAVIEVRDGGPGLTPDDIPVAFEHSALYQRYRGLRPVGTGVGLALVHALATRLGATAAAGRAAEGGALFAVRLPRTRSAIPADAAPAAR